MYRAHFCRKKGLSLASVLDYLLSGNIPVEYLSKTSGEGKSVEFVKHLIRYMGNKNFILALGYDLPYEIPSSNILAISRLMKNKLSF